MEGFRNLKTQNVDFERGLNVICGENAQGKTNTLEAIYLCAIGKSPKSDKDKEMINIDASQAKVSLIYESKFGEGKIDIALFKSGKKSIVVNSVPILRIGELMGYFNAVWFSPDELKLVKLAPNERRRFMDIDICQTDKSYYYSLSRYNKILTQRNNLLKEQHSQSEFNDMLSIWDAQLIKEGAKLVFKRKSFIDKLAPIAKHTHYALSGNKENLETEYITQVLGVSYADITDSFNKLLLSSREKDISLRYTSSGAQRDDVKLSLSDKDVRVYGSQGQQRTSTLSLKLAETELIYSVTGDRPVLLLDDVLSELDKGRQQRLMNFNKEMQIILTTTDINSKDINGKFIAVKEGLYEQKY